MHSEHPPEMDEIVSVAAEDLPIEQEQTAQDRKILRVIAYVFASSLIFVLLVLATGYWWITSEQGREWLRHTIEKTVSDDTLQLRVGAISTLSFSGVKIERITLHENQDMLLSVPSFYVTLKPQALLTGRIHITEITAPDVVFGRLPTGSNDDTPKESASLPDINQWTIPDLRIDKLLLGMRFMDDAQQSLSLKGRILLDPNRIMHSHLELDVADQNDDKLVELRFVNEKNKPLIFMRLHDPNRVLLTRFAAMDDAPVVDFLWQGALKESDLWQGEMKFAVQDMVTGNFNVLLNGIRQKPVLTLDGHVAPIIVTDQSIQVKTELSSKGMSFNASLDQWMQGDMVITRPMLEITAKPAVQFIVHQGYQWELKSGLQEVLQNGESLSPFSENIALNARGRLGRTKLSVTDLTLGNSLWQAEYSGYYHVMKSYLFGEAVVTLNNQELQKTLGGMPIVKTDLRWDAARGLQLTDGVLDVGHIQGVFNAVLDPENTVAFNLNAQATDFAPHYQGQVLARVSATGALDNPALQAEIHSDQITLASGMEIHAINVVAKGDLNRQDITAQAALPDGEYQLNTVFAMRDGNYIFHPLQADLPLGRINGKLSVTAQDAITIQADLHGHVEDQDVVLKTEIDIANTRQDENDITEILLKHLSVEWKKLKLRLQRPAIIQQQQDEIHVQPLSLWINGGTLSADAVYAPEKLDATITAKSLPLAAMNMPIDAGTASGTLRMTGSQEKPNVTLDLALNDLVPHRQNDQGEAVSLSGKVQGHFADEMLDIQAALRGIRGVTLNGKIAVPMTLIPFALADNAPLTGYAKGQIDLMAIVVLALLDGHELHGRGDVNVTLGGTVAKPDITGNFVIQNGRYEHLVYGTKLHDLNVDMDISAAEILIRRFSARDDKQGNLSLSGVIGLKPLDNPRMDLTLASKEMQILNSPSLAAKATSNIFVKGRLDDLAVSGDVYIHDAEIFVNDIAGAGDPYRDYTIVEKNLPSSHEKTGRSYRVIRAEESNPIRLNIDVDAPNAIFVRGPGLDSEWRTALAIRGTTDRPRLNGSLSVLRGSYQFVDLLVNLKPKSQVVFNGEPANPDLSLSGIIPGRSLNATLSVTGNVEKPVVELSSDQGLPSDEILARVLFGRSANGLTAAQAVQVARILARLSGQGGAGFDPIGVMRNALGVDTLGVNMGDEDGAGPTVSVGKYISDDIFVSVEQGSGPNTSVMRSEIRLTDQIQVETQNSTEENKIGIQWRWNY